MRFEQSLAENVHELRCDYDAARPSKHMRRRTRLGGTGDAHISIASDFERIREQARDMDRNESMVGPLTNQAVTNQLQTGITLQPNTGDEGLDTAIFDSFTDWADDPQQCDYYCEHDLWQQFWYGLRGTYVDGDMFSVLTAYGNVQMLESDRCVSPRSVRGIGDKDNIVHGVELKGRRKEAFHFCADPGQFRRSPDSRKPQRVPAYDADGNLQVCHLYNPMTIKRRTQSRGISAFAPVFPRLTMFNDTQFSTMIKQQIAAMAALVMEREVGWRGGTAKFAAGQTGELDDDSNTQQTEKMSPGMVIKGAPGEKVSLLSSAIPSAEYLPFVKLVLTEIGLAIGVPLVLALMDAKETNFSGWRGAVDAARMGFRVNQKWFISKFPRPMYRWWLRNRVDSGEFGPPRLLYRNPFLFRHTWGLPAWPYIQPLQDAQANAVKLQTGQMSPYEWAGKNGQDWETHARDVAKGWAFAVREAKTQAALINSDFPDSDDPVTWREIFNLQMPGGLTLTGEMDQAKETANAG